MERTADASLFISLKNDVKVLIKRDIEVDKTSPSIEGIMRKHRDPQPPNPKTILIQPRTPRQSGDGTGYSKLLIRMEMFRLGPMKFTQ